MQLDEREQEILDDYLSVARKPHKVWIVLLALGGIFSVAGVILVFSPTCSSPSPCCYW